jgi:hypothetical protein
LAVVVTPESALGKELWRWDHTTRETNPHDPAITGMRPATFQAFPKMIYKAVKTATGKVVCMPPLPQPVGFLSPNEYFQAYAQAEAIQKQCFKLVDSDEALRVAKGQGWTESPDEAIAQFEREEQALGNAAAEAAFQAQRMSDKARIEFTRAQDDTMHHVADVVPDKKKKARAANADEE